MRQFDFSGTQTAMAMTGERDRTSGLGQAADAFTTEVLRPLLAASIDDPEGVRRLAASFREKLDALDLLLGEEGVEGPTDAGRAPRSPAAAEPRDPARWADDAIGRNQRSRVRELTLLEVLAAEARPYSLMQLMRALEQRGFEDGQPAIVSQLHRMKKVGVIEQPASGMYEVTEEGLSHLRKLKSSVGGLVRARPDASFSSRP